MVVREIDQGGNGIVEEVWPGAEASHSVALKRLKDEDRQDIELVRRFQREVRILRSLDHPNIMPVIHAELESNDPWFTMPLASSSLAEEVRRGPLSAERIRDIFVTVLSALDYAHQRNVLHRDLKPHNILIMSDGQLLVSDFGLGRALDSKSLALTRTGQGRGTEGYAAPEQWDDFAHVDQRADIYALGALLYEMTTRRNPLIGDPTAAPHAYRRVIQRCRAHDPARRYASISELQENFELLWREDEDVTPAAERAIRLLGSAITDADSRRAVVDLYLRHPDNSDLYSRTLALWSKELIAEQVVDGLDDVSAVISNLCNQLTGNFNYEYLDGVASFFERIYESTDDDQVRELILSKLLQLGAQYNRWNLGRTFARLAAQVQSRPQAMLVRDVLLANAADVHWVEGFVRDSVGDPLILKALE